MDYSSHSQKLGQRKTENQRSLEPQHVNISPWQREERERNTREVMRRLQKSCYRMISVHLNMVPWCCCQQQRNKKQDMMCSLHVCSPDSEGIPKWGRTPCSSGRSHWCIRGILKDKHVISISLIWDYRTYLIWNMVFISKYQYNDITKYHN